jgi:GcrA cell cycle regulator
MGWEPQQIEILKSCIAQGLSAQKATELIPGFTRSAILGKAYRMNLQFTSQAGHDCVVRTKRREEKHLHDPLTASVGFVESGVAPLDFSDNTFETSDFSSEPHITLETKRRSKRRRKNPSSEEPEKTHVKVPYFPITPLPPNFDAKAPRKTLETVKKRECHFPLDNAELGEFTYCGLPTHKETAYCEFHYKRIFNLQAQKR